MKFLDQNTLNSLSNSDFQSNKPYPWVICKKIFLEDSLALLRSNMPDIGLYTYEDGWKRVGGQKPHVRHGLVYKKGMLIPKPWLSFLDELDGPDYRNFLRRMFGVDKFDLTFYWQLTGTGCGVSPHCDSERKIGSHLFYLNDNSDWNQSWGGATLILDDEGKLKPESNPDLEDLKIVARSESVPNSSLLFARTDHSWHGVRELTCPENISRKLFTVIVYKKKPSLFNRLLRKLSRLFFNSVR